MADPKEQDNPLAPTFVVGVGASAGGLEAIEQFFDRAPTDSGMAFVIVQHLSPDYRSLMGEVLARWTTMPVLQVEDGMRVERDSIYLIPPKKEMIVSDGRLLLTDKDPEATLSLPIDHFFRSLGLDCGRKAIAIVMSGTGSDGSRGVVDVHEAGGLVIAQNADSAKFDGMPRAAEDSGVVDLVMAPEEMPDALKRYASSPRISEEPAPLNNESFDDEGLKRVFQLIRDAYGLDFSHYKLNTVVRRMERRLVLHDIESVDAYIERLVEDPQELNQLYRDFLVGVTRFFRDPEAFASLRDKWLTDKIKRAAEDTEIRVWIAGCATGEEAYSLAILLDEAIVASGKNLRAKVFATDVHAELLEIASAGVYPEAAIGDIGPDRLARYFARVEGGYQVSSHLRQLLVFAPHNLVKDAPFTKLDLITCRNLLIYLLPYAQQKVLSLFHFGLKSGGALLLGPSETTGEIGGEFDAIDSRWKIFRKRRDARIPVDIHRKFAKEIKRAGRDGKQGGGLGLSGVELLTMSTYDALLEDVLPPSLLISERGELLHTFGDAGKYLQAERGRHSSDVRDRFIESLRMPVSTAITKTFKEGQELSYTGIPVPPSDEGGDPVLHEVSTRLVSDPRRMTKSVLVQIRAHESAPAAPPRVENYDQEHLLSLESELRYTKENLQATIEELETSNEELQASNEELIASNEELQSTNEELHSVNEELYTVNAEHQSKIVELSELTRDMDSLLECTEIDTVFLDADLRIRKYTPGVAKKFSIQPQDIGRPIGDFTHSIECDDIAGKINQVLRTGEQHEEEVRDRSGEWFLMRVLPYRSTAGRGIDSVPDGALLTLVDITTLKGAFDSLEESVQHRDRFLAMLSHELRNPLATIVNASHLLTPEAPPSDDDGEPVAIIQRQTRLMATLLDDLLDVTRVSRGKIQIQRRPFDLTALVERARESVDFLVRSNKQSLVVSAPDEPVWVSGSEPRILQVLSNLLINASKYSGRGDEIRLSLAVEPGSVVVSVSDEGVGIAPDQTEKIFELFVQADRTLDRTDGGLGIGLTLVKLLVELHEGEVSVASDGVGQGSEFRVRLPTCPAPEPAPGGGADLPAGPGGVIRRLALIEDNLDASKMLAYLLEDAGYEVSVANNGRSGYELICRTEPDAAIVDLGLPEMNGYEVARSLRKQQRDKPLFLIAVTGYGQARDRAEALQAGFDEHLVKPVDPESLNRLLRELPHRRRSNP